MSIQIDGLKGLEKKLKKISNIPEFFDDVVFEIATDFLNALINDTPEDKLSGLEHTKNLWFPPDKITDSFYQVENTKSSQDGKHSIAAILNYGRKEVRPIRAKRLYIPLSRKAKNRNKKWGEPIPDDFVYGVDYVLAKKAKKYDGTGFIDDNEKKYKKKLKQAIIDKIKDHFK